MLILSIFPGIDLLGRAFEEVWPEACLVRGPDLLWGGEIKNFHPSSGVFDGVIGGPPCQIFSRLRHLNPLCGQKQGNLIPEFERIVAEAQPKWFLMECVPEASAPVVPGFQVQSLVYNNRWAGGVQHRERRFSFGSLSGLQIYPNEVLFETPERSWAITSSADPIPVKLNRGHKPKRICVLGHGPALGQRRNGGPKTLTVAEMAVLQGLPPDFLVDAPFTVHGKQEIIGNGVPLPMGRAIARAVKQAIFENMS